MIGPALPGLAPGALIDRAYALSSSGGCLNDTGTGCTAGELAFALDVNPAELGVNQSSHRNFRNTIGLQMAFNNSNTVGVRGSGGPDYSLDPAIDNPQDVQTGLEFSIPLSQIGSPSGNIKLTVFLNGSGHDYISNQFGGAGILNPNIGSYPVNLDSEIPGSQYVTLSVPEPASLTMFGFGAIGLVALRQTYPERMKSRRRYSRWLRP